MDFNMGIRDSTVFKMDMPCGNYILIDRKFLNEFLEKNGLRLGYIVKTKYITRDASYSYDLKEVELIKAVNLSSVVLNH